MKFSVALMRACLSEREKERADPTRSDPIRCDPMRSDPTRPDPTRPDSTRPDLARSGPIRFNRTVYARFAIEFLLLAKESQSRYQESRP